jgi:tetratricopeptide (TPR) repeat protein
MTQLLVELDYGVVARKEALKEWATMRDGLEEATVEAESAFEEGNVEDAILDCKRGLEIDMHDERLSSLLKVCKAQVELAAGQAAIARTEFDEAVTHFERGLLLDPENTKLQVSLGVARREADERGALKLGSDRREQLGKHASETSDAIKSCTYEDAVSHAAMGLRLQAGHEGLQVGMQFAQSMLEIDMAEEAYFTERDQARSAFVIPPRAIQFNSHTTLNEASLTADFKNVSA